MTEFRITLLGVTSEVSRDYKQEARDWNIDMVKTFAGKQAGICYMKDSYFDTYVSDAKKAYARFGKVAATGHHSIADHVQVTLLLEGIPKFIAMFLNNEKQYATSEKSGRYTVMTGTTELEMEKYKKWGKIFQTLIAKEYGDKFDDIARIKLAQENARYMLSIFTPTTMSYTTSIRQLNYLIDWLDTFKTYEVMSNFSEECKQSVDYWFTRMYLSLQPYYIEELRDTKKRGFSLINKEKVEQVKGSEDFVFCANQKIERVKRNVTFAGSMFSLPCVLSYAGLAQAQRHRTLSFCCDDVKDFYVPKILSKYSYALEWLADMMELTKAGVTPQGRLLNVVVSGDIDNFCLMCEERLCGRAQLEIACATEGMLKDMVEVVDREKTPYTAEVLQHIAVNPAKCKLLGGCKEGCKFKSPTDRLI